MLPTQSHARAYHITLDPPYTTGLLPVYHLMIYMRINRSYLPFIHFVFIFVEIVCGILLIRLVTHLLIEALYNILYVLLHIIISSHLLIIVL